MTINSLHVHALPNEKAPMKSINTNYRLVISGLVYCDMSHCHQAHALMHGAAFLSYPDISFHSSVKDGAWMDQDGLHTVIKKSYPLRFLPGRKCGND